jgi:hypothetical protein
LAGVVLQRTLESRAFEAGGQTYDAPAQRVGDFLAQRPSTALGQVEPSYKPGVKLVDLATVLPDYAAAAMREALPAFGRKIKGYDMADAVLTGLETRTSSPLRITRDPDTLQSLNVAGLFPAGEGAGYAGGILSAAVDGIKVAEAAKVIENTQRDLNIALINELALIFHKMGLDTQEVLEAAGTKWNFLNFRPGLVGGHCIGVDPYYLTHKAQEVGCHPEIILAGRRINDGMGPYIASQVIKLMLSRGLDIVNAPILVLGLTFKENCPDLRNTRVVDLVAELRSFGARVDVHDPWADPHEAHEEYGLDLIQPKVGHYRAIVLAVAHQQFKEVGAAQLRAYGQPDAVLYDVKHLFPADKVDGRL